MGDVINLRRARKAKQRHEAEQKAAQARALHGRTKSERAVGKAEKDRFERHVEQSRLESEPFAPAVAQLNDSESGN